ncbi:MAG TPA: DUF4350 domain-containing protein [Candidatus Acidoferrum sp.]|nr:DUF4350 domain-containing protein [Candidatus Acidoferrum sp.]
MPAPIAAGDRKILLIAGAVLVVLTAGLAFLGGDPKEQGTPIPSTYSANPGGARAAYLLLQDLHYKVSRWERSPTELPTDDGDAVLIIAEPFETPSKEEQEALLSFVEEGGQVIFTGARINAFFPKARIEEEFSTAEWKTFSADVPSNYTAGAPKIVLQTGTTWQNLGANQLPLYGNTQSPVVVSWRIGEGRVLWWAAATPLTNSGISQDGNLNLFLNAMNFPVRAKQFTVQIYWDEYFHGERTSLWSYVRKTPVAWGLVQISVLGLIVLFTFSRRSGPTVLPPAVSRLAPLEFVDTLGGLYERAGAEPAVVGFVYQQFRATLSRQLRISSNAGDTELADAVQTRLGWKEGGLKTTLARALVASRARKVEPEEALGLVRELEGYEEQLGLKKKIVKEKS